MIRTNSSLMRAVLAGLSNSLVLLLCLCLTLTACGGGGSGGASATPPSSGGGSGGGGSGGGSGGGGSTITLDLIAIDTDHVTGVAETSTGTICVAGVTRDAGGMPLGDHISVDADLLGSTDQALDGQSGPGSNSVAQDATPTKIVGMSVQANDQMEARNWDVNGDGSGSAINPADPGELLSRVNAANPHGTQVGASNVFAAIVPAGSNSLSYLPLPTGALSTLVASDISETNPGHTGFAGSDVNRGWVIGIAADSQFRRAVGIWLLDSSSQPVGGFILPFPADVTSMEGTTISPDSSHIGGLMVKNGVQVGFVGEWNPTSESYDITEAPANGVIIDVSNEGLALGGIENDGTGDNTFLRSILGNDSAFIWHPSWSAAYSLRSYLAVELGFDVSMFVSIDLPSMGRQYVDPADPTMSYLVVGGSGENVLGEQQGFVARFEINISEPTLATPLVP